MKASAEIILFLQSAITPVALISGVGLLLLSINNRLGRTIDRSRELVSQLAGAPTGQQQRLKLELQLMYRRSRLLRNAIGSIVVSMFIDALIIPLLFAMSLYDWDLQMLGYILFFCSVMAILLGLYFFMADIRLTLRGLKLEMKDTLNL